MSEYTMIKKIKGSVRHSGVATMAWIVTDEFMPTDEEKFEFTYDRNNYRYSLEKNGKFIFRTWTSEKEIILDETTVKKFFEKVEKTIEKKKEIIFIRDAVTETVTVFHENGETRYANDLKWEMLKPIKKELKEKGLNLDDDSLYLRHCSDKRYLDAAPSKKIVRTKFFSGEHTEIVYRKKSAIIFKTELNGISVEKEYKIDKETIEKYFIKMEKLAKMSIPENWLGVCGTEFKLMIYFENRKSTKYSEFGFDLKKLKLLQKMFKEEREDFKTLTPQNRERASKGKRRKRALNRNKRMRRRERK